MAQKSVVGVKIQIKPSAMQTFHPFILPCANRECMMLICIVTAQGKTPGADRNIRGKKAAWFSDIFHAVFFYCAYIYKCTHTYTVSGRNRTLPDARMHTHLYAQSTRTYTHNVRNAIRHAIILLLYAALYATPGPAAALYRKLHSRLYGTGNIYKMHTYLYGFRRWAVQNPIFGGLEVFQ